MAVIPVKWNWEDALDKKQEQSYNDLLCDILRLIQKQIDKSDRRIRRLEKRQNRLEKELRIVIKNNKREKYNNNNF